MDFGGGTISHSPNAIANGASKDEIRPLNVTIVGAGIGGLTAAIFLRQQGHIVTLLEQSRFANELGAAVHLAPNANGLLRRIGLNPEAQGAVNTKWLTQWTPDGKELFTVDLASQAHKWQHPWQLAHRVNLHSELKRLATTEEGAGTPAVLRTRCRVVHVDTEEGTVTLEDGEKVYGDLVVGADGVHSKTRKHIPGVENIETFGSGKSAFRFLIPKERALADSETRKYVEREGHLHMVFGRDRRVVIYPTSNNTLLNFVNIHPTAESQTQSDAPGGGFWQSQGNISKMLEIYKDFEPAVLKLLSLADEETLKVWELIDMAQLPTWTEGKLVLIGDAAHPFTPHQGQGAGQAIEDAASLAVMLHRNIPMSSIPSRLKLYERCRYERASRIQEYSRIAGKDLGTGPPIDTTQFTNYNFGHDEWDYSMQALRKWEWTQKKGLLWRMPVSFGPMPGPRQDFEGRLRDGSTATFATTSIKFKTSRTVLENLFPTEKLRFASADTVAYATLSHTRLDRLQWLGGRGYSHFGLYIHGVQYSKDNGETMRGSYLPVLFENLADPILSGREELGFPKLFCDLDLQTDGTSWSLEASWMSAKFCTVKLAGLQDSATTNGVEHSRDTNAAKDEGLFFSKYIPTTGSQGSKERGQADVEYMAFLLEEAGASGFERKVVRTLRAQNAEILFDALDWEALPTLHHIVQRLKEIPVYEIVEAKLVEGTGVSDVNGAHRLE